MEKAILLNPNGGGRMQTPRSERQAQTAPRPPPREGHFILGNKFEFYVNETGRPEGF